MAYYIAVGLGLVVLAIFYLDTMSARNLPPGPKRLPIIGSPHYLPPSGTPEYLHWDRFAAKFGNISSLTVFGQVTIILHDKKAVNDLLRKQKKATANRPVQPFADLCGFGKFLSSMQFGDEFKRCREMIHEEMSKDHVHKWSEVQDIESRKLLRRILDHPENLTDHFKTLSSAVILKITYGYDIQPDGMDDLVLLIQKFMDQISSAYVPLSRSIDIIPWLQYLPEWFPGAGSKKIAREWRRDSEEVVDRPYSIALSKFETRSSYVSSLVQKHGGVANLSGKDRDAIKWTAAIMYGGGADTTSSVLTCFLLAMVKYPRVQEKAQEEIDQHFPIGAGLPGRRDQENLKYVVALIKECHRWFPIVPMGQSHVTTKELWYQEYRIPRGSLLRTARRSFLHDRNVYTEPEVFEPERYLEPRNEPDPTPDQFGYGERTCPGRLIAQETLFITIVRILATMHISKRKHGGDLDVEKLSRPGIINCPGLFPYSIRARSGHHVKLIRSEIL